MSSSVAFGMFSLHREIVTAPGAAPQRFALVLHGIFGAGKNWLFFSRKLAALRPDWGFVLPDLRGHGQSQGAPPPHDVAAAAADLDALARAQSAPFQAVFGHSFGGKVALAFAAAHPVGQLWLLDSNPGAQAEAASSPTLRVLSALEALEPRFQARADFIRALESQAIEPQVASWLAMSLRRAPGGDFSLGLDLPAIRALLADYFQRSYWGELERRDRDIHVVVAGRSFVWLSADLARLAELAAANPSVRIHRFADAGHWVHVDAADELLGLLSRSLPRG